MTDFDYPAECPHCGAAFAVSRIRMGRQENCPVCRGAFVVGAGDARGPAAAAHVEAPPGEEEFVEERAAAGPALAPPELTAQAGPAIVCCVRERKRNPIALGPLVTRYTGLTDFDATRQVTRGRGILADGIPPDRAEAMVEELREEGVEAYALPLAAVPPVERELPVHRICDADERALHVETDAEGSLRAVPWRTIVTGICFRDESERRTRRQRVPDPGVVVAMRYGMATSISRGRTRLIQEEPLIEVALVLRGKGGRAFALRFDQHRVRYGLLGDRLKTNAEMNLVELLRDVLARCPHAFFPAGFRRVAGGALHRVARVAGPVDRGNYLKWAVCCAAARGLFR